MILVCPRCGGGAEISLEEIYSLAGARLDTVSCECCRSNPLD